MKSKRRHELKTNELADAVGRLIVRFRRHGRVAGYLLLVAAVALFVLVIFPAIRGRPSGEDRATAVFNQALAAEGAEPLREFVETYREAPQTPTARLALADRLLSRVVRGADRAEGDPQQAEDAEDLAEAKDLYGRVAGTSKPHEPMARVGLALVALQEGDLENATRALREVDEKWPDSVGAAKARAHLEAVAGYEPVAFSDEPLEEQSGPAEEAAPQDAPEKKTGQKSPDPKKVSQKEGEEGKPADQEPGK